MNNVVLLCALGVFVAAGCESPPRVKLENQSAAYLHVQLAEPGPRHKFAMFYSPRDYEFLLPPSGSWSSIFAASDDRKAIPLRMRGGVIVMRLRSSIGDDWHTYTCQVEDDALIVVQGERGDFTLSASDAAGSYLEVEESTTRWFDK